MKKLYPLPFLCFIFFVIVGQNILLAFITTAQAAAINIIAIPDVLRPSDGSSEMFFFADSTDKIDVAVSAGLSRPKTGFSHIGGILLENRNYNGARFINLTIRYDTTATFISCNYPALVSTLGSIVLYFDTLMPFEKKNISLEFITPIDSFLLNHFLWLSAEVTTAGYDLDLGNNSDSTFNKITGAFDPNEKSVMPEGFGPSHYVPVTQEEFKYTIDFQNTGTDTAINITITDTISSYLDPFTLLPGASSHPYSWEILSPGILKFHFTNIYLPDSNVNEPRSHGFVSFVIKAIPGLNVGTFIKNSAYIYFDFNAPVATNTVANELFDCNNITNFSLTQNNLCSGDFLSIYQNIIVPHTSFWYLDTALTAIGDTFLFSSQVKGFHQITLVAQTPFCTQFITQPIFITSASKPVITQSGLTLTSSFASSYQWFLNSFPIPNAQSISYLTAVTGWYSVSIVDGNGCEAFSDSVFITHVGLPDIDDLDGIIVYPIPFTSVIHIFRGNNEMATIDLTDLEGRVLLHEVVNAGNKEIMINTSNLASGVYAIRLIGSTFVKNKIIVKQ